MNSQRNKNLLNKYLNNECSKEELDELLDHIHLTDDKLLEYGLEEEWNSLIATKEKEKRKTEDLLYRLSDKQEATSYGVKNYFYKNVYSMAVALIGFIVICLLTIFYINNNEYTTNRTGFAEIREVVLPDGSKVTLNSNSLIRYKKNWSDTDTRTVTLEGEAFFSVIPKNNGSKFLVQANEVSVEAIGTEFNVLSRRLRSLVVLEKGTVKLDVRGKGKIIMKPGQLVEINPDEPKLFARNVNTENYGTYRKNLLVFHNNTLAEIAQTIEDTYGSKIIIEDKHLAREKYSGVFPTNEDIKVFLKDLSLRYNFEIESDENRLIFKKK